MKHIETNSTTFCTNKFRTLDLAENNLVLTDKNKEKNSISFSELDKIYIQKYKLNFLHKVGLLSIVLIPIFIFAIYLPIELVILASIAASIVISKIHTYKRYQLYLLLNDGTLFIKDFKKSTKHCNINIVNEVRKKIFENQNWVK